MTDGVPEWLDKSYSAYVKKQDGTDDRYVICLELGGVDGLSEAAAYDTLRLFDQILPIALGPMLDAVRNIGL